jgi:parallel beta-helix repeat protein
MGPAMSFVRLFALTAVVAASLVLARAEAAGAATPIVSSHCPQVVSGAVQLQTDLVCADTSGLIVGSNHTSIDFNGHKIVCVGPREGLVGGCHGDQGGSRTDPDPDIGIDTAGFSDVRVFSRVHRGTIDGFDIGLRVRGTSTDVLVQRLFVTSPSQRDRPRTQGILVTDTRCGRGHIQLGGEHGGNEISNHASGIALENAACVDIVGNTVHENGSARVGGYGIFLRGSSRNLIRRNRVFRNGDAEVVPGGGISLGGTGNAVTENWVNSNAGNSGISVRDGAAGNVIAANTMLFNFDFDAAGFGAPDNHWAKSNICRTQNEEVPPGVCNPNEG